ncbi:MAG: hypothetical protein EOO48_08300 [Flavobacterium sp.]|nr:MAG: hypothetical protein EOO48_08300 [Flavobacterium sp.]
MRIRQNSNGFLGIFDDREVGSHTLENNQNGLFAYVLNGTFQIENNLIEKNDAIALGGVDAINFKAFSADSLLMLIEIPV